MIAASPSEVAHLREDVRALSGLIAGEHEAFVEALSVAPERLGRFAGFVGAHGLRAYVHAQLAHSPARTKLPRWWLDQLKAAYLTQWVAQERLVRELDALATLFEGRHEVVLLKGPYTAMRFYGGLGRREFADLDLLIRRRDLAAVERLLRARGYARKSQVVLGRALTAYFTHALDFVKGEAALDLHWALTANAAHALDYEAIWRDRQSFVLRDREYVVLSDEYEIVFNLISIFKDLERGAARVKAFVDLHALLSVLDATVDWRRFFADRKRERLQRVTVSVLELFLALFECTERFPNVAAAVARERPLLVGASAEPADLLGAPEGALRNKLWAANHYDCSRLQLFSWWLVSLPFRLAVHAPGRYPRVAGWRTS